MAQKRFLRMFAAASAFAVIAAGCASHDPVPGAVQKNTYSLVQEADKLQLPSDIELLTLEEAQNLAVTNNPDFKTKYFAIAQARAQYYKSFSSYFPTVNANFEFSQAFNQIHSANSAARSAGNIGSSATTTSNVGLSGSLLVFDSFQREMNVLAAKHNYRYSQLAEDDARRLLLYSVAYAYNNVMLADAQMKIAKADMDYNTDLLKDTKLKYDAGAAPLSDVLNYEIQYNKAESSLISAQYSYATNKYVLAGLLGLTDGTIPDNIKFPTMPTQDSDVLGDISVYLDIALSNRPDLKAYRELYEQAKYSYWSSLCAFGPSFSVTYSLGYTDNASDPHANYVSRTKSSAFGYGLVASWNLFSGGSTYFTARAAQASMMAQEYSLAQAWIDVVTDVRTAYDYYKTTVRQVKLYQQTFQLTKQTRDLVEEEYKAGSAEITRMNEAQRDLIEAENNLVTYVVNMANAKAQLQKALNVR